MRLVHNPSLTLREALRCEGPVGRNQGRYLGLFGVIAFSLRAVAGTARLNEIGIC